jgi:hypothetical protein
MKDGDSLETVIYGPQPGMTTWWILIGFSGSGLPDSCSTKNWKSCLCICENSLIGTQAEKCSTDGVCISLPEKEFSAQQIKIEDVPFSLSIKQEKNVISFVKK